MGKVTEKNLHTLGIRKVGDLARLDEAFLEERFGKWGLALAGKSPRTRTTYETALRRFHDYLEAQDVDPAHASPDELQESSLHDFYTILCV